MSREKKKGGCLKTALIVIVVLAILGVIGTALGKKDDKVKDATAGKGDAKSKETKEKTEFAIGETAEQKGIQITLLSTTESSGNEFTTPDEGNVFLLCEFEITNNSEKDIAISSIASFEAYCDDYSINQDILGLQVSEAEGKNQLDGSVAAGKKMNGIIAYQVPAEWSTMEIKVSPDFWSSKDITFVFNK